MAGDERSPWRRDPWIAAVAVAVFAGVLMVLPVPEPADPPGGPLPETNFAVVDVTVFDGEEFRPHRDVRVEDGRIRAVGQRLRLPDDLPRVDGRGHTLLPGLIDAHTHTYGMVLNDSLRFGVTTVFDQFTQPSLAAMKRPARESLARTDEADLFSAGNLATAPGGHGTQFGVPVETLTSPGEAPAFVAARKEEGADWIKIVWEDGGTFGADIPTLDRETIAAVIEAAHAEELLAVIHVSTLEHGLAALDMGIDGLVHVWGDEVISEEDAARFAEAGVFVIPTLSVRVAAAGESMGPELLEATEPQHVSPMQRQTLTGTFPRPVGTSEAAVESVRRLHAAGVRILAGTDAPNPGTGFGISMHGELRLLERAGLSPAEALAAATAHPPDAFGIEDRGRLARGRIADLLLVAGDLENDLSRSTAIAGVWKDGFPVEAAWVASYPKAPDLYLISDFTDGVEASFGLDWQETADSLRGGSSHATLSARDGALHVEGALVPGFVFLWAGAIWSPGEERLQPVDFTGRQVVRFRVRGDGGDYAVQLFGAAPQSTAPGSVPFTAPPEWTEVEIPLERFESANPGIIAGLSFVATGDPREFAFELDDVEIR